MDYLRLILALVDIGQVKKTQTHRRHYFKKFMPENISENLKSVKLNSYNKAMFAA